MTTLLEGLLAGDRAWVEVPGRDPAAVPPAVSRTSCCWPGHVPHLRGPGGISIFPPVESYPGCWCRPGVAR
jgi:hypothetical protein